MINNISNSQVSFSSHRHPVHQLNRLSKALSAGKTLTRLTEEGLKHIPAAKGGELAVFKPLDNGRKYVDLAKPAEIKRKGILESLCGSGKNNAGAAKSYLARISDGDILVTDVYGPTRTEYLVKKGSHGIELKLLA